MKALNENPEDRVLRKDNEHFKAKGEGHFLVRIPHSTKFKKQWICSRAQ